MAAKTLLYHWKGTDPPRPHDCGMRERISRGRREKGGGESYFLYVHGSDVSISVLKLDEKGEPVLSGALVHAESYILAPVLAWSPAY